MRTRALPALILALSGCSSAAPMPESGPSVAVAPAASPSPASAARIPALCAELDAASTRYGWDLPLCSDVAWKSERDSVEGRPLIWAEFGDPASRNKTLILAMVHPDEITPLYLGLQLAHHFRTNPSQTGDAHVVIAPLVNPDGFFRAPPIRMNARGVDVNRNFDTPLWREKALSTWTGKLKRNPRRFPGNEPSSEPETEFQEELIRRFSPAKILSIHAPLNLMDYDGPSNLTLDRFPREYVKECTELRSKLRARSTGFFPGSLGNYAGVELGIPTITLELPSANPKLAAGYWRKFKPGIHSMVRFRVDRAPATRP